MFRTEDIVAQIEKEGQHLALVVLSGVQYFTGQFLDIKNITEAAHKQVRIPAPNYCIEQSNNLFNFKGAYIGWDLAHAVGNVELKLHEWDVDFAAWCTYKYMNSGAGSIGGLFLHEKHFDISQFKKLDGWWSHRFSTRFEMSNSKTTKPKCLINVFVLELYLKIEMEYAKGALAYGLSNTSILLTSCLKANLDVMN